MQAFLFRLSALAIRFLCPLVALALSNAETMGKYYLFISYFTFVVGVSSLELAVLFSWKFLRCRSDRQRRLVFTGFLVNQVVVTSALAIPAGVLVAEWAGIPVGLIPLFCLSLATEACVNEIGRFFWNIGQYKMPSLRDLVRAMVFTTAIVASVYLEKKVLTPVTFLTITIGNVAIIGWEWKFWGRAISVKKMSAIHQLNSIWSRVRHSLFGSLPQFVHMQLLGLQPLLERTLIEKSMGLAAVASFSLLASVMQSAAGLQLVPMIAQTRQRILGVRTVSDRIEANRGTLILLRKIAVISGAWALIVYLGLPLLPYLLEKEVRASPPMFMAVYLSSVSAIFCSAISPLLTEKRFGLKANLLTILVMAPLLIAQWIDFETSVLPFSLVVIAGVATLHLLGRIVFIQGQAKRSQHKG